MVRGLKVAGNNLEVRGNVKSAETPARSRGFASRLLIGLSSAVCIVLFQNCGTDFVPLSESQLSSLGQFICSPSLQENFNKTYYSFARSNCAACHGTSQSPRFALPDAALSYSQFNNTDQATFKEYALNPSHGGGAGGLKNEVAINLAESRFDGCKSGGGGGSGLVTARTTPLTLNATNNIALRSFTTLDSQLEVGSTNLGGARLHFQVRVDTAAAVPAYFITRPSLQTGTASVAVRGITIRINGNPISSATAFTMVDRVIPPNTNPLAGQTPNGNLSTGSAVFEFPGANPLTDTVQFEFELLQAQ